MRTVTFLVLFGLSACATDPPPEAPWDGDGLSDQIAVRVEEGATLDLAALAPFEWMRFCAFHPYTTAERAQKALGFQWPYAWDTSVDHDEVANFLVFVNGNTVVAAFDHTRDRGDFAGLDAECFKRTDARFVVSAQGRLVSGNPHFILRTVP